MPASPRISPVFGRSTATPPNCPPSASTAARCDVRGRSSSARPCRRAACSRASTRAPARSTPPGRPATSRVEDALEARDPDGRVVGDAARAAASSTRAAGTGPSWPAIAVATGPRGEVRWSPSASGVPSRARMSRAGRQRRPAVEPLAAVDAGEREVRGPVDAGVVVLALKGSAQRRADRAEDARRDGHRDAHDAVRRACRPCPARTPSRSRSRPPRGSRRRTPRAAAPCARRRSARRASRRSRPRAHAATKRSARSSAAGRPPVTSSANDGEPDERPRRPPRRTAAAEQGTGAVVTKRQPWPHNYGYPRGRDTCIISAMTDR